MQRHIIETLFFEDTQKKNKGPKVKAQKSQPPVESSTATKRNIDLLKRSQTMITHSLPVALTHTSAAPKAT